MAVSRLSQTSLQNAFQKYNNVWDGRSAVGSMDALGTALLSTTTANVIFSNIPQTYSHLQIRGVFRSAYTPSPGGLYIAPLVGGAGGGNYYIHYLTGTSTTGTASYGSSTNAYYTGANSMVNTVTANYFVQVIIDIPDYTNTTKQKVMKTLSGWDSITAGAVSISSMVRYGQSGALTALTIDDSGGGGWLAGSQFSLYGIK